ncbi:MAG: hypothetical protein MI702_05435, partial [Chlorobiales bacterium]|nr:hypothetical protein [Chlorobiales bacterium]
CGGNGESSQTEQNQGAPAGETTETSGSEIIAAQETTSQADKNAVFAPKPVQLSETRYLREMISEELERAYNDGGEFIDPRRVIQLLENDQGTNNSSIGSQGEQEAAKTWRISHIVHNEAKALFEKGNISAAAAKWRNLATDDRSFTISIEVDCNPTILQTNYALVSDLELPVFILEENIKGRDCFRLCAGVFPGREEAEDWIDRIKDRIKTSFPFVFNLVKRSS